MTSKHAAADTVMMGREKINVIVNYHPQINDTLLKDILVTHKE